jgi:hypothetical protein
MRNKISMKVLMEAMNKLETEANYKSFLPDPKKKNFVMSVDKLAAMAAADERDSEEHLDGMYKDAQKDKIATAPTKPGRHKASDIDLVGDDDLTTYGASSSKVAEDTDSRENFMATLLKVAEDMDFGGDTKTMTYDLADTQEDEPYDTTEMVGFVDAAADALAANLSTNMEAFHGLSPEEMEDRVKSELMDVLRDMDNTDLYDRS